MARKPRTQMELLRALMRLTPRVHVFGGLAEDALLYGRQSRAHEDVDVMIFRDEIDLRLEQARELGFERFHLRMQPVPERPLVVGSIVGEMNLEYVIFDRHDDGRISFDTPTPDGLTRVWLPDDALDWPVSTLDGVEVRTVSPLTQYQIRIGVTETFGGMRPKDVVAQAALRRRFFAHEKEADLRPRTELLEAAEAGATPA